MARGLTRVPIVALDYLRKDESAPMELIIDYDNGKIYSKSRDGLSFIAFNKVADDHIANGDLHVTLLQKNTWTQNIQTLFDTTASLNTLKAPLDSPTFTGVPKVPTAATASNDTTAASTGFTQAAIKAGDAHSVDGKHVDDTQTSVSYLWTASKVKTYVDSLLASNDAMIFKGTLGTGGTITAVPTTGYGAGWAYKIITTGTYAGQVCQVGDMILCIKDYATAYADSDWTVFQTNIDGAVTGSSTTVVDGHIAVFDGTTGRIIKTSSKSLPAGNVVGDTSYGTTTIGGVVKSSSSNNQVSIDASGLMTVNLIDAATKLTGIAPVANGGSGKNSVANNAMLYASAANVYSEVTTSAFGRSLLNAASGTTFANLNSDMVDGKHVDDAQVSTSYLWTASKTKAYVDALLSSNDAMIFKGTLGTGGSITALPTTGYYAGWSYKVITAGTYAGQVCQVSDLIICVKDFITAYADSDWIVVQTNIDGAVVGPASSTDNHIVVFDGTTGKLIKSGGKVLPSGNVVGDTSYGTSSTGGVVKSSSAENQVAIDAAGLMTVNNINVSKLNGQVPVDHGGLGKSTIASGSMLYASAANLYSEVVTSAFGRSLLNAVSGTVFTDFNSDMVDGKHVDDAQETIGYLWTAFKTKAYVDSLLASNDAMIFKGTIGTDGTVTALPTINYEAGWSYKVVTAGTYAGINCEIGDLIICIKDYNAGTASVADWTATQTNLDGAVTGSSTSVTDGHIAIFDGATGKVIKTSNKALPAGNLVGDTSYGTSTVGGVVKSSSSTSTVSISSSTGVMTVNTVGVTKGGTGKTSAAINTMLYASAANVYSDIISSSFGRSLLNATSGIMFAGLNADMLDDMHLCNCASDLGATWGYIPAVKTNGSMEVGNVLDFHAVSNDAIDYAYRLTAAVGELTASGKFTATELKTTSKVNINDRASLQFNATDNTIEFVFAQ